MTNQKDRETSILFVRVARGIRFEWQGGPYITLFSRRKGFPKQKEDLWINNATIREPGWYVTDVSIGVWDYEKGGPSIPVTKKAFDRKVDEWISENDWSTIA